jgi:hypothetical protein
MRTRIRLISTWITVVVHYGKTYYALYGTCVRWRTEVQGALQLFVCYSFEVMNAKVGSKAPVQQLGKKYNNNTSSNH